MCMDKQRRTAYLPYSERSKCAGSFTSFMFDCMVIEKHFTFVYLCIATSDLN